MLLTRDVKRRATPAIILPIVISSRGPCFLSTRNPNIGMKGSNARRKAEIAENSVLEMPNSSDMGMMKKDRP